MLLLPYYTSVLMDIHSYLSLTPLTINELSFVEKTGDYEHVNEG